MRRSSVVATATLLWATVLLLDGLVAQEGQGQVPAPDTAAVPAPIPVAEIPRRALDDLARLASFRERLAPDSAEQAIAAELDELLAWARVASDTAMAALGHRSLYRLEPAGRRQAELVERLESRIARLEARSQLLAALGDSVSQIRAAWQMTSDSAERRRAPPAARRRARELLAATDSIAAQLSLRSEESFALLSRLSVGAGLAREALTQVETAVAGARSRLFWPDSPPLWRAAPRPERGAPTAAARLQAGWEARQAAARDFADRSRYRIAVHLGVLFLLVAAVRAMRRRLLATEEPEAALGAHAIAVRHPVASVLLLALLASAVIYEDMPIPIVALLTVVGLVAGVWLLRDLVSLSLRAPLYGLAGLFALDRIRLVADPGSLLYRLSLLGVTLAALGAFAWFFLARRRDRTAGWRTATLLFARLGIGLLAAALVANVLGFVILADLLTGGVIWSAALALILTTAVLVADGLVRLAARSAVGRQYRVIRDHESQVAQAAGRLLRGIAVIAWLVLVLAAFGAFDPVWRNITAFLSRPRSLGTVDFRLGDWLLSAITLWVAVWLSKIVRAVLDEDVLPKFPVSRGIAGVISALTRYAMLGIGLAMALAVAGIELDRLALVAGALGVGIGFGLQNLVSNFVSGLVLLFERPIQVGDTVEVGSLVGEVRRIGVRSSTVRTFQGADVIVPNANFITNQVVNWTLSDRLRRLEVKVGVVYGSDPERVRQILLEAGTSHPDVLKEPEPTALFQGFGESSLDFSLRVWTARHDRFLGVQSEVTTALYAGLRRAGIEIPFPQRDLHVRSVAPEARGALPTREE